MSIIGSGAALRTLGTSTRRTGRTRRRIYNSYFPLPRGEISRQQPQPLWMPEIPNTEDSQPKFPQHRQPQVRRQPRSSLNRRLTKDCYVEDLKSLCESTTDPADYPYASQIVSNVVVYDSATLPYDDPERLLEVEEELLHCFSEGPGIAVLRGAISEDCITPVSDTFAEILKYEAENNISAGDHFGKSGANGRVWNALEKLAVANPTAFVRYYSADALHLAARAWLGPQYQVTSQCNIVYPGCDAQLPHRDYHLGFMGNDLLEQFPAPVHDMCAALTLQGAVAHSDMPLETGPTQYLPHSQKYTHGYLAYKLDAFKEYFQENYVQLPLKKGDVVFFNPALFHAAGSNSTKNNNREANLLQISSAFGRAMENVNYHRVTQAVYPALLEQIEGDSKWSTRQTENVICAAVEDYPFPTNLDKNPPVGGLAPESLGALARRAVFGMWPAAEGLAKFQDHWDRRM